MISRSHRFHGHSSLKKVYTNGQSIRGGLISLRFAERSGRAYRVAVVVSRKVSKSAVVRNRIRRRVYEIVRQYEPSISAGTDLVFTAYNEQLAKMGAEELETLICELLDKVTRNQSTS